MRIQVIHAHPLTDSYDHALYRTTLDSLRAGGHEAIGTDLYREGFPPAMTARERASYMGNDYDGSDVAGYIETLRTVDGLILVYPHWWYSMPAILKGYLDRVWAPGTAFVYDAEDHHLEPHLHNIRLLGVVTTFGSPWWIVRLFAGDPGRKVVMKGMKPMCAKGCSSFWLALYDMDHATDARRERFLATVRRRLQRP
jgi:NAD(P)H dehydrogenase (quinone)